MHRFTRRLILAALTWSAVSCWAQGTDAYPQRQIRLLVGFAVGGPTDVIARVLAKDMSSTLGQPVVVENKPSPRPTATRCWPRAWGRSWCCRIPPTWASTR